MIVCIGSNVQTETDPADDRPVNPQGGPAPQVVGFGEQGRYRNAAGPSAPEGGGFLTFLGGDGI
jgi:hypothetical protein